MSVNRREFVILSCACAAGCAADGTANAPIRLKEASIDAGPASAYAVDGLYDRFIDQGFVIRRQGIQLVVLSAICTHKHCKLKAEPDHMLYCKCHGSTFNPDGKVTQGPATRDLPILPSIIDEAGRLIVKAVAV